MKKLLVLSLFAFLTLFNAKAQEVKEIANSDRHNELKINATNLIAFSFMDVAYERLLNEESSVGLSLLFSFGDNDEIDFDNYRTFSATGFYRHFFSKKYAKGFFVEGFGMLNTSKDDYYLFSAEGDSLIEMGKEYTDFALGVSAGGKFVTRRGFVAEVYLGLGRNLFRDNPNSDALVGRGGISLGYRF